MNRFFRRLAEMVEEEFGSYFDRKDGFFECPECGEPIYDSDWEQDDYMELTASGHRVWRCPVCGEILIVENEAE